MCFACQPDFKPHRERFEREWVASLAEIPMGTDDGHEWRVTGFGSPGLTRPDWFQCEPCGLMLQEITHWGNDERSSWEARAWHRNKRYKDRLLPYSRFHGGAIPPICKGNLTTE